MDYVIEEVKDFYKIIKLKPFRRTEGVTFDILSNEMLPQINSIDKVIHKEEAISPGSVEGVERPWYMHPFQEDNLMVLYGTRHVDIYSSKHKQMKSFTVTPDKVICDGEVIADNGAMLVWSTNVFHRIVSGKEGSASLNLATHHEGIDMDTNFSIYDLDINTGEYKVIRKGELDQF
ncbi:hypothetical protein EDC19_1805 [Natranaerovirga hydrolytica]|uniref:Uncharacterized protein n=1 Tax=Natranaerovirga hydrolytica TaxID=680378 RepID=A0A4R1MRW2_9FIRM|nr:hypothetical protein [Natranaerovirga hydrolytica]TCK92653.1 hypothetical protein EDC19_1805 [Natranaerovirga hydrolytica]